MKKVLLIALGFFTFQAANAQEDFSYKPTTGTVTTEVGLNGGLNNADFNLNGGVLKFRYFLKDDLAIRAGLGIDNEKDERDDSDTYSGFSFPLTVNGDGTTTNNESNIKLGVEKHFAGSSRLSTYVGADFLIGFGKNESEVIAENGNYLRRNEKTTNFGAAVFTGADYYIAQKVYLGVEAGLNFISTKVKDTEISGKSGNNEESDTINGSEQSTLNSNVFGGIRIGFQF